MDFVAMAQGAWAWASRATTAEEFNVQFAALMEKKGPQLVDAMVSSLSG